MSGVERIGSIGWNLAGTTILACLLLLLPAGTGAGAVVPVDGGGLIGKEATVPFVAERRLEAGDTVRLSGDFRLDDPTVFYPLLFRMTGPDSLLVAELSSSTDSTWSFSLSVLLRRDLAPGDTLLLLTGEALAGADTTTRVIFSGLLADGTPREEREVRITTIPIGPSLRYVRFGRLDPGRPNPVVPGDRVSWGFRIDQQSDVIFTIYDLTGRMIIRDDLGRLDKGVYRHSIAIDLSTPSGFYLVHLATELGHDYEEMHVLH